MAIEYPTVLKLTLLPVGNPWVRVGLDGRTQDKQLSSITTYEWDFNATDQVCLSVEHFNKSTDDSTTAVEIAGIEFFGITDPKFAWAGTYYPDYPKLWYDQQEQPPGAELPGQTYLGWNGVYRLTFDVPVFTWMHKTLNLGWIYQ